MSIPTHPKARGIAARRALLAILLARSQAGMAIPPYATLGAAIGISAGQISRHMAVLMDEGAFVPVRVGMHTRIQEVRQ